MSSSEQQMVAQHVADPKGQISVNMRTCRFLNSSCTSPAESCEGYETMLESRKAAGIGLSAVRARLLIEAGRGRHEHGRGACWRRRR
eukprot:3533646-Pleurochrysis_carterae.AAC.1